MTDKNLGHATAYGYAKSKGYTGTEEEFAELMASYADVAESAKGYAEQAEVSASNASTSATDARSSASTASTKANEASASASNAQTSASNAQASATSASTSASSASASAQTASTKAGEASASATSASESATSANSAKEDAVTAKEEAQASAEEAKASEEATDLALAKLDASLITDTATGNPSIFPDGANLPVKSLTAQINPKQDLNGYDYPWVGGAGKNKLGGLVTTTETKYGVTHTANSDGTFTVNGTNSSSSVFDYHLSGEGAYRLDLPVGDYKLSGGVQGLNGSGNTLYLTIMGISTRYVGNNGTSDTNFSIAEGEYISSVFIRMASGATANNAVFKPMIRLATESDATFAPYENICPITGYDEVNATRTGKNLIDFDEVCESGVDTPSVLLKEGTYYLYVANDKTGQFNTFAFMSSDNVNFVDIGLETGADAYVNQRMGYAQKKCIVTVEKPIFLKVKMQINNASIGAHIKVLLTRDATNYDIMPNVIFLSDALFQEIYEPCQSQTVTVELNGTVYGGTLDMGTGELVVDKEYHAVSEFTNWLYSADSNFFCQTITGKKAGTVNIICDEYQTKARGTWTSSDDCVVSGNTNTSQVYIRDSRYTTDADFRANVTASICYELATPQTIQLTASQLSTLLGTNVISADSGAVTVEYYADTKLYINKVVANAQS